MNFILKKIDAYAVRIVGEFDSFADAFAAKEKIYANNEFTECFIDIVAPEGQVLAPLGAIQ
jgi:hypothetical protein